MPKRGAPNTNPLQQLMRDLENDQKEKLHQYSKIWLDSLNIPLADIRTINTCITLAAPDSISGGYDLIIADFGEIPHNITDDFSFETKLKTFQGMYMQ